jgi:Fe-Mn family superoxide dismutase
MAFELPALPYSNDALAPHISKETLEFHHGKHHAGYVTKLNAAVAADSTLAGKSLEDLVRTQKGGVFNNAAQIWNHTFYWNSLKPKGGGEPTGAVAEAIKKSFGSFGEFKTAFSNAAGGHFGSGWAWLVKDGDKLAIVDTHDAGCPLTLGKKPILTCDVWEHAYYIDYRNARPSYIEAWWNLVNWDFANKNL